VIQRDFDNARAEYERLRNVALDLNDGDPQVSAFSDATDALVRLWRAKVGLITQPHGARYVSDKSGREMLSICVAAVQRRCSAAAKLLVIGDAAAAERLVRQVEEIAGVMDEVQHAWPWFDEESFEESYRQYEQGTLMDFETFKNVVLKATE
jgi:hypothetical protein